MVNIVYLMSFLLFSCTQPQECLNQIEIIKIILNDNSINTFFKNKDEIIVGNSFCENEIREVKIGNRDVTVKLTNGKIDANKAIIFLEYESTEKIIFAELTLYNKNVIHTVVLKKINDKIILVNKWTTFIKSKN